MLLSQVPSSETKERFKMHTLAPGVSNAYLHTDNKIAHLVVHVLVLLEIPEGSPHVGKPHKRVQYEQGSNKDDQHQSDSLQVAVLSPDCTAWVSHNGMSSNRTRLVICNANACIATTCRQDTLLHDEGCTP